MAKRDRSQHGMGTFYYILGDLHSGSIYAGRVVIEPGWPGEPGGTFWYDQPVPPDIMSDFYLYEYYAKQVFAFEINIPAHVTGSAPAYDAGGQADTSTYLRSQLFAQIPFVRLNKPYIKVRYADGSTATFVYQCYVCTVSFIYHHGSARDAEGNPIGSNDQSSSYSPGSSAGEVYASSYYSNGPITSIVAPVTIGNVVATVILKPVKPAGGGSVGGTTSISYIVE